MEVRARIGHGCAESFSIDNASCGTRTTGGLRSVDVTEFSSLPSDGCGSRSRRSKSSDGVLTPKLKILATLTWNRHDRSTPSRVWYSTCVVSLVGVAPGVNARPEPVTVVDV